MGAKVWILVALLAVGAAAVGARASLGGDDDASVPQGVSSLVGSGAAAESEGEGGDLEVVLPYVTEASLFAVLGFALGYLSRKVIKIGLIVLGVAFLLLQTLSWLEVVAIDWTRATELVNAFVLNWNTEQPVAEILKDRIPSAGGLALGYALGFRRG